jgi:hypothetical protein
VSARVFATGNGSGRISFRAVGGQHMGKTAHFHGDQIEGAADGSKGAGHQLDHVRILMCQRPAAGDRTSPG